MRRRVSAILRKIGTSVMPLTTVTTGRTFDDVLKVVNQMTNGTMNSGVNTDEIKKVLGGRCPENIDLTNLLLDRLHMRPIIQKLRFVHVAGTKGKGTTSTYTSALLRAYGFKVGLFTSPHLVDVRERIKVNNKYVPKDLYTRYFFDMLDRYNELANSESQIDRELGTRSNFFRFMFLLSLYIFAEESVDVAVMEVGMGGRLDSTNVLNPEVCVITALGLDHMEILGETMEEIAGEKAGILKSNTICYVAPQHDHPLTRKVLEAQGRKVGAPVVFVDDQTLPIRNWPRLAIGGSHVVEDSKLALLAARRVADIPPLLPLSEVERNALQQMTLAGRSQIIPIHDGTNATLYLDGAHTQESLASATRWFLEASSAVTTDPNPRRVLLFYSSRDPEFILKSFMPYVQYFSKVIIYGLHNPRIKYGYPQKHPEDRAHEELLALMETWRSLYREVPCLPCKAEFTSIDDLLELALPAIKDRNEDASKPVHIFVSGSFFLLADIMRLIE